jgi:hypothetical protein
MRRTSQIENYPRTKLNDSFAAVAIIKAIGQSGHSLVLISVGEISQAAFCTGGAVPVLSG